MGRKYQTPALDYAIAAVKLGPLYKDRNHWRPRKGRAARGFNSVTINLLLASGAAQRTGDRITAL